MASYAEAGFGGVERRVLVYIAMWFKFRRWDYKVKRIGMNLLSQGSDGKCYNIPRGVRGVLQYSLGSDGE